MSHALIWIKSASPNLAILKVVDLSQQGGPGNLRAIASETGTTGVISFRRDTGIIMRGQSEQTEATGAEGESQLTISPEKVCFIIMKAREFDAKDQVTEPEPGSNPSDDMNVEVLEEHEDDPVVEELTSLINSLSEDEQIDLVALAWLGRDDYSASDWTTVREEAARAHNQRTADYLLGMPLVGDYLEEGLSMLGYSCEEFEIGRL